MTITHSIYKLFALGLLLFSSCCSYVQAKEKKASDFFKNPNAKQDLVNLMNTKPKLRIRDDAEIPYFSLGAEFGVLLTFGNTDTSIAKLALNAEHELERWSNKYYSQLLKRKALNESTLREQLSAQLDYKLTNPDYRLFAFAEYDDNEFIRLKDQMRVSIGWSHLAWTNPRNEFRYSIGPGWTRVEQQGTGVAFSEAILRFTADFTYQFESDARIEQYLTAELGEVNTRVRSQTSINAKIAERLGLKLSFEIISQEDVLRSIDRFSTQTSISMVYNFF